MILFLLACGSPLPVSSDSSATAASALVGHPLVRLEETERWQAHPGVGGTRCSLAPGGLTLRLDPDSPGPGYCWLGLVDPLSIPESADLVAVRARWTLSDPTVQARVQVELEGPADDVYIDWPVGTEPGGGSHLSELAGPVRLALRLAVDCPGCERAEGLRLDQLEVVSLNRSVDVGEP